MMAMPIPYGKSTLSLSVPEKNLKGILRSRLAGEPGTGSQDDLVRQALEAPIDATPLWELAKGKKTAVVIISDHTRPVPSRHILPHMLAAMRRGNPTIEITLLVATGCHRGTTEAELLAKLGPEIVERETIAVHDCDHSEMVDLGALPSGARLVVNRLAAEADLLVAEGFIEPHFFAGFSGGRKSLLPGICDRSTVLGNHCAAFIDSPLSRTGILEGNPIHEDMVAGAKLAKLCFVVNVVINEYKEAVAAFAGDVCGAHRAGCDWLSRYCYVPAVPADIVVTSNGGAPLDQNLYQCVKSLTAAEATAAPGGVLILCAECADGHGGQHFYEAVRDCASADALMEEILATPQEKTVPDQWQYQILARILRKHRVIVVTRPELKAMILEMKMDYAETTEAAMQLAFSWKGPSAGVVVIPDGVSVIVR